MTKPTNNNTVTNLTGINACGTKAAALAAINAVSSVASEKATIAAANSDNCGPMPLTWMNVDLNSEDFAGTDCQSTGGWTVTRIYNVVDACNNVSDNIKVVHSGYNQTGPTFNDLSIVPDATYPSSSGVCDQDILIRNPKATNACGTNVPSTISISAIDPDGFNTIVFIQQPVIGEPDGWTATFPLGTSTVTITATDDCGLMSTHVLLITIEDVSPPTFPNGCPSNIVPLNPGTCDDNPVSFTVEAEDDCGVTLDVAFSGNIIVPSDRTSISSLTTITESYFRGTTIVKITATNPSGFSNSCSFTIEADPTCGYLDPCTLVTEVDTDDLDPINIGGTIAVFRSSDYTTSSDPANGMSSVFTINPDDTHTIVPSGHNVAFYGGNDVRLLPGFEVKLGATFLADIAPCF